MRSSRMAVNSLAAALFIVVGATPLMAQGPARRPVLRDRVEDVRDRREDRRTLAITAGCGTGSRIGVTGVRTSATGSKTGVIDAKTSATGSKTGATGVTSSHRAAASPERNGVRRSFCKTGSDAVLQKERLTPFSFWEHGSVPVARVLDPRNSPSQRTPGFPYKP